MKVLITADIHINDYANYNYSPQSRLKSFEQLANRLVEIGKSENCEEIWILGDLVDKPNSRPYILHEANKFVNILCDGFDVVRYILGNHDLDTKSQDLSENDTQVTIFSRSNLEYMDRRTLYLNGHKFAFMNWRPEQDLDWLLPDKIDVLFGHFTKMGEFGQEIDESKFDLFIHGDIHNSQVIGKFVSVCNPIQKDMSSEQEGKVIIFDTATLDWKRVLVDPDHTRFLQISYTKDQSKEGFNGPLQYNIFKPEIELGSDGEQTITFDWNDINELITKTFEENKLTEVHSEILSDCDTFEEIDFDFQLIKLQVHGYRSIEDLTLDFSNRDRIALLGENGSGKSSIIGALQGAFLKNSYLKSEQSEFTDDMSVILTLQYQNKIYEITKGSTWRLTIDGQEQPYSGVRDFEQDLVNKLPFINYLDLFFLNSNVSDLSSQFSQNRRIDLISKFYRLDRINSLYSTAMRLYHEHEDEKNVYVNKRNSKYEVRDHIKSRLTELESMNLKSKSEYESELDKYKKIREQYESYIRYKTKSNQLEESKVDLENDIKRLEVKLSFDYDKGLLDLKDLKSKANTINEQYELVYKKSIDFESELKKIQEIEQNGKNVANKLNNIKSGKCPECGASLGEGKMKSMLEKYNAEYSELLSEWDVLDAKISQYPKGRDSKEYFLKALSELKSQYKELNDNIEILSNKINSYNSVKTQHNDLLQKLEDLKVKIQEHNNKVVSKVVIPQDLSDKEYTVISNISKCDELINETKNLESIEESIKELDNLISIEVKKLEQYDKYLELTSVTGLIYENILKKLAIKFSTTEIKYEVESGFYRGSRFINFNAFYLVRGKYRLYDKCSAGQKTVCDLDFLDKLFSVKTGLLVLDEYLKHLDDNNFSKVCELLTQINANTIILCTHDDNLTAYTRRIILELDSIGRTVVKVA